MTEREPVNVIQLAIDARKDLAMVLQKISDWKIPYFVDESLLSRFITRLTRRQVLECAKRFSCIPGYSSSRIAGEIQIKQWLYERWKERFQEDLGRETCPDTVREMIGESLTENGAKSAAVQKWLSLKREAFERALSFEELQAVCRLPIGVDEKSDPVIASAFARWRTSSEKKLETISSLEALAEFSRQCHRDLEEQVKRLYSSMFGQRVSDCKSLKQVMALERFAISGWMRYVVREKAQEIALKKLKLADTKEKILRMIKRKVYREFIFDAMLLKLIGLPS